MDDECVSQGCIMGKKKHAASEDCRLDLSLEDELRMQEEAIEKGQNCLVILHKLELTQNPVMPSVVKLKTTPRKRRSSTVKSNNKKLKLNDEVEEDGSTSKVEAEHSKQQSDLQLKCIEKKESGFVRKRTKSKNSEEKRDSDYSELMFKGKPSEIITQLRNSGLWAVLKKMDENVETQKSLSVSESSAGEEERKKLKEDAIFNNSTAASRKGGESPCTQVSDAKVSSPEKCLEKGEKLQPVIVIKKWNQEEQKYLSSPQTPEKHNSASSRKPGPKSRRIKKDQEQKCVSSLQCPTSSEKLIQQESSLPIVSQVNGHESLRQLGIDRLSSPMLEERTPQKRAKDVPSSKSINGLNDKPLQKLLQQDLLPEKNKKCLNRKLDGVSKIRLTKQDQLRKMVKTPVRKRGQPKKTANGPQNKVKVKLPQVNITKSLLLVEEKVNCTSTLKHKNIEELESKFMLPPSEKKAERKRSREFRRIPSETSISSTLSETSIGEKKEKMHVRKRRQSKKVGSGPQNKAEQELLQVNKPGSALFIKEKPNGISLPKRDEKNIDGSKIMSPPPEKKVEVKAWSRVRQRLSSDSASSISSILSETSNDEKEEQEEVCIQACRRRFQGKRLLSSSSSSDMDNTPLRRHLRSTSSSSESHAEENTSMINCVDQQKLINNDNLSLQNTREKDIEAEKNNQNSGNKPSANCKVSKNIRMHASVDNLKKSSAKKRCVKLRRMCVLKNDSATLHRKPKSETPERVTVNTENVRLPGATSEKVILKDNSVRSKHSSPEKMTSQSCALVERENFRRCLSFENVESSQSPSQENLNSRHSSLLRQGQSPSVGSQSSEQKVRLGRSPSVEYPRSGHSPSVENPRYGCSPSAENSRYGRSPSVENPRYGRSPSVENPRSGRSPSVENPRYGRSPSVENPRSGRSPSVENPRYGRSPSVENPRSERSPSVENPRYGRSPSVENPRYGRSPSVENPRSGRSPSVENPRSERSPSVENPRYGRSPSVENPRYGRSPSVENPRYGRSPSVENPRSERSPSVENPRYGRSPSIENPRSERSPSVENPRYGRSPSIENPRSGRSPSVENPRSERSPSVENPRYGRSPSIENPRYGRSPSIENPRYGRSPSVENPRYGRSPSVENPKSRSSLYENSRSRHSSSVENPRSRHLSSVENSRARHLSSVENSRSGHSSSDENPRSGHSSSVENPRSGRSTSVENPRSGRSPSVGNSRSRHSPSVDNPRSGHSLSVENPRSGHSPSVGNSRSRHSSSVGNSRSGHSPSVGNSRSRHSSLVENPRSGHSSSDENPRSGHSSSVGNSRSGHSPSVGNSRAQHSSSVENSRSGHSPSVGNSRAQHSSSVGNSRSGHSPSVGNSRSRHSSLVENPRSGSSLSVENRIRTPEKQAVNVVSQSPHSFPSRAHGLKVSSSEKAVVKVCGSVPTDIQRSQVCCAEKETVLTNSESSCSVDNRNNEPDTNQDSIVTIEKIVIQENSAIKDNVVKSVQIDGLRDEQCEAVNSHPESMSLFKKPLPVSVKPAGVVKSSKCPNVTPSPLKGTNKWRRTWQNERAAAKSDEDDDDDDSDVLSIFAESDFGDEPDCKPDDEQEDNDIPLCLSPMSIVDYEDNDVLNKERNVVSPVRRNEQANMQHLNQDVENGWGVSAPNSVMVQYADDYISSELNIQKKMHQIFKGYCFRFLREGCAWTVCRYYHSFPFFDLENWHPLWLMKVLAHSKVRNFKRFTAHFVKELFLKAQREEDWLTCFDFLLQLHFTAEEIAGFMKPYIEQCSAKSMQNLLVSCARVLQTHPPFIHIFIHFWDVFYSHLIRSITLNPLVIHRLLKHCIQYGENDFYMKCYDFLIILPPEFLQEISQELLKEFYDKLEGEPPQPNLTPSQNCSLPSGAVSTVVGGNENGPFSRRSVPGGCSELSNAAASSTTHDAPFILPSSELLQSEATSKWLFDHDAAEGSTTSRASEPAIPFGRVWFSGHNTTSRTVDGEPETLFGSLSAVQKPLSGNAISRTFGGKPEIPCGSISAVQKPLSGNAISRTFGGKPEILFGSISTVQKPLSDNTISRTFGDKPEIPCSSVFAAQKPLSDNTISRTFGGKPDKSSGTMPAVQKRFSDDATSRTVGGKPQESSGSVPAVQKRFSDGATSKIVGGKPEGSSGSVSISQKQLPVQDTISRTVGGKPEVLSGSASISQEQLPVQDAISRTVGGKPGSVSISQKPLSVQDTIPRTVGGKPGSVSISQKPLSVQDTISRTVGGKPGSVSISQKPLPVQDTISRTVGGKPELSSGSASISQKQLSVQDTISRTVGGKPELSSGSASISQKQLSAQDTISRTVGGKPELSSSSASISQKQLPVHDTISRTVGGKPEVSPGSVSSIRKRLPVPDTSSRTLSGKPEVLSSSVLASNTRLPHNNAIPKTRIEPIKLKRTPLPKPLGQMNSSDNIVPPDFQNNYRIQERQWQSSIAHTPQSFEKVESLESNDKDELQSSIEDKNYEVMFNILEKWAGKALNSTAAHKVFTDLQNIFWKISVAFSELVNISDFKTKPLRKKIMANFGMNKILQCMEEEKCSEAFDIYRWMQQNQVQIEETEVPSKLKTRCTKILLCAEMCIRAGKLSEAIRLLKSRKLLIMDHKHWKVEGSEDDIKALRLLWGHILKLLTKRDLDKAFDQLLEIVNSQEKVDHQVTRWGVTMLVEMLRLRKDEKSVCLYASIEETCHSYLDIPTMRMMLVALVKQNKEHAAKRLFYRATMMGNYPHIKTEGNTKCARVLSYMTREEMMLAVKHLLDEIYNEAKGSPNLYNKYEAKIVIEMKDLKTDKEQYLYLQTTTVNTLSEAQERVLSALACLTPPIDVGQLCDDCIILDLKYVQEYLIQLRKIRPATPSHTRQH